MRGGVVVSADGGRDRDAKVELERRHVDLIGHGDLVDVAEVIVLEVILGVRVAGTLAFVDVHLLLLQLPSESLGSGAGATLRFEAFFFLSEDLFVGIHAPTFSRFLQRERD